MTTPEISTPSPYPQKPGMLQAIAIMTLINGILNILWGAGAAFGLTIGVVTICLVPFGLLPLVLGIFEIIYAVKLLANPPQPVQPSQVIAILEICCILLANVISLIVGILVLVFYNDPEVKAYFARINNQPLPTAAATALPALPEKPAQETPPAKAAPKKSPRKVAETKEPKKARTKKSTSSKTS